MKTFMECWLRVATSLFSQALAGEPKLKESSDLKPAASSFGFAAEFSGDVVGRLLVLIDSQILAAPLHGEGIEQKAGWAELLREIAEAAAGELLATTGRRTAVETFAEVAHETSQGQLFELESTGGRWSLRLSDETRESHVNSGPEKTESRPPEQAASTQFGKGIDLLLDVELEATLRFGCRELPLGDILKLGPGDVVELDRHITDPVDLIVGDKIVARGEVVLINGDFGLRVTEVAEPRNRLESIRCLF